jgi:hypothetical protein
MTQHRILGESDWEDEDLLTFEEAGERLQNEIAVEEAIIKKADAELDSATVQRAQARLDAMRRHLERAQTALAAGVGAVRRLDRSN